MDILRKSLAPISDKAWEEINDTAVDVLTSVLSARKVVDVEGPKGWDYAALSTGRINVPDNQKGKVKYGTHEVLPMVEARVPFKLNIWELDNVARGAEDIDLDALEDAAREIAKFEEKAIYEGFKAGKIAGLKNSSDYSAINFPDAVEEILDAISLGVSRMKANSIEGPYSLVLNTEKWHKINSFIRGYPLRKQLENLLGGSIILAPNVNESFLVSQRGGDFRLVLGQDLSIGYESHNNKTVELYFTESFTFQVIDPAAVIVLK
ncbi:MAG: family 1 encapsulin nanocompartment shell protein [Bacteroidales bacterium]